MRSIQRRTARFRPGKWSLVTVLLGAAAYALFLVVRGELVDFEVYRTAAGRALAAEPLYRAADGHYQYKYLPAFAFLMSPFARLPKEIAEGLWFGLSVGMAAWFVRLSVLAVPYRRLADDKLIVIGLLLIGKFLIKELAFGQTNLLLGIVLVSAVLAAQRGQHFAAGFLVGVGVFVKPYALVLVPWLLWVSGPSAVTAFTCVIAAGIALPAAAYGWAGNLELLQGWYRTVTGTTSALLLLHENISFASMWAKWLRPLGTSPALTAAASGLAVAIAGATVAVRRRVTAPACLEYGMLALLVPLLSPQGWDYLLIIALPGYLCLADRWRDTPRPWRAVMIGGVAVTSFAIFDLMRRPLYEFVMNNALPTLGTLALVACLVRLRWRGLA